ncbi:hypothetical protein PHYBLDRAFT_181270 [Phycomyces blakesleeanus NRRL 1555(-)]|uniref:Uncharacterized protein n=1 Tax=Phycomyces blakesleeanus (strain ATCC 8743b / DSM 1359 / FGSC 10004 / NBRC 33097 / NRRL 1555) TaxID=763407 RepID=A0A162PW01_PHYB8|nr:hypothetical protein PHYBLDRAFT_181163 [Phycomyces blakesleeanus NRRL 1555(-)]XP_018292656.1 hypothetical protein PHYBLDRAFT_181270 [Phycomyces blakesleeanus NRRL 1555(-)]OAD74230.1 hypothetical protein PHYBLDRAFT_181163 [Phycomyces blakesleeanus NRRL 1555(-)]OAD74616.1 hypothetical protein PHYBLDRAFT_181270 [Phycomyces blakesleeanus NRRL 1555(-)]|eukprot:XP_018292270.1 hypothetical protein PHYBLDRAFT_181163 [Phycomyces blakesleeanus NRRL 1555(-)]
MSSSNDESIKFFHSYLVRVPARPSLFSSCACGVSDGWVLPIASLTPQRSRSPPHSVLFHEVRTGLRPVEDGSAFIGGELRF